MRTETQEAEVDFEKGWIILLIICFPEREKKGKRLTGNGFCEKALKIFPTTFLVAALLAGCGSAGREARDFCLKGRETLRITIQDMEILEDINNDIASIRVAERDPNDVIKEGRSLVVQFKETYDRLEAPLQEARRLFSAAAEIKGSGSYSEYGALAERAVRLRLDLLEMNERYIMAFSDMLDVIAQAQTEENVAFYREELNRMGLELDRLRDEMTEAAVEADDYYRNNCSD